MTEKDKCIESGISERNIDKTPKSDIIFKILFGDQKHPRLLIHLLNSIIKDPKPITSVEIKQTELTPEFVGQRGVRLDVLAKTSDGKLINVEIQKHNEHNMIQRSLFHCAKIFSGQAVVSEKYEDLKRTICINIMNFKLFDDARYWRRDWLSDSETHERLTDLLEIHFLELPKIRQVPADSPMLFWMEFINDPFSDKIQDMYALEEIYSEAKLAYEKTIADPSVRELLRIREKADMDYKDAMARNYEKGEKIGIEKGIEKGRAEERAKAEAEKHAEKIETAKRLLSIGLSVEQIASATGLPAATIESLRK